MNDLLTDGLTGGNVGSVQALGWSLIHFLWQGTLIALALESALVGLRNRSADARYLVRCAALTLMAAAPVVTFWILRTTAAGVAVASPPLLAGDAELRSVSAGIRSARIRSSAGPRSTPALPRTPSSPATSMATVIRISPPRIAPTMPSPCF